MIHILSNLPEFGWEIPDQDVVSFSEYGDEWGLVELFVNVKYERPVGF